MLLKGTALVGSYTLEFTIHGERNNWKVSVGASECETQEATWYPLFNEMLADACEAASHSRIPAPVGVAR